MSSNTEPYYRRNAHTAWQIMPEGGMILHLRARELSATNVTGAAIWEALEKPCTARQLSEMLAREFEVEPEQAVATVESFLAQLQEKGLVEVVQTEPGG